MGEILRCSETQVMELGDAWRKGYTGKSAIAEHQWDQQHKIDWEGIKVLDRAMDKAHQRTPANNWLNHDRGYELPGCWIATVKMLGGSAGTHTLATSDHNHIHAQLQL